MRTKIGIELWVDYAHSLMGHGKCALKHGHTGKVIIEIEGEVKGGKTFTENVIMDFNDLKAACEEALSSIDHKDLDELFAYPTTENIAKWLFSELKKKLPTLSKISFSEGKGKWCTVEE